MSLFTSVLSKQGDVFGCAMNSHHTTSAAAFDDQSGMKNVMAANSLINVELWESHHINAAETRMNSGF
jgi:hypothetical protein